MGWLRYCSYLLLPLPSLYPLYLCLPIFTSFFPISLYFFLYLCIPVYLCLLMLASFRPLSLFTFLYLFLPHSTPSNSFYLFSTSLSTSLYLLYLCLPLCTSSLSTSFYFFLSLCTLVYPSLPVFASLPTSISLPFSLTLSTSFYLSLHLFLLVFTTLYLFFFASLHFLSLCTPVFLLLFTCLPLPFFTSFYPSLLTSSPLLCLPVFTSSPLFAASFVLFLSLRPFSGSLYLHFSCAFPFHFPTPLPLSVCPIFFRLFLDLQQLKNLSKSLHENTLAFVATTSRLPKTRRKIETSNRN